MLRFSTLFNHSNFFTSLAIVYSRDLYCYHCAHIYYPELILGPCCPLGALMELLRKTKADKVFVLLTAHLSICLRVCGSCTGTMPALICSPSVGNASCANDKRIKAMPAHRLRHSPIAETLRKAHKMTMSPNRFMGPLTQLQRTPLNYLYVLLYYLPP